MASEEPTPANDNLDKLLAEIPDDIEVICLCIQTSDHKVHHFHYTDTGEWTKAIG